MESPVTQITAEGTARMRTVAIIKQFYYDNPSSNVDKIKQVSMLSELILLTACIRHKNLLKGHSYVII